MRLPGPAALLILFLTSTTALAESATEIVRKADLQMRGKSSYTETTMQIVRPDWTRTMSMKATARRSASTCAPGSAARCAA